MLVIKRYKNRKLYNTSTGQYVTLPEVANIMRQGQEFLVVSNVTKRDITRDTCVDALSNEIKQNRTGVDLTTLKELVKLTNGL